jgi:hypothetical protein
VVEQHASDVDRHPHPSYDPATDRFYLDREETPDFSREAVERRLHAPPPASRAPRAPGHARSQARRQDDEPAAAQQAEPAAAGAAGADRSAAGSAVV